MPQLLYGRSSRPACTHLEGLSSASTGSATARARQQRCGTCGIPIELDLFTTAAPENCFSVGRTHVLDPLHVLSEHRHQISLPGVQPSREVV